MAARQNKAQRQQRLASKKTTGAKKAPAKRAVTAKPKADMTKAKAEYEKLRAWMANGSTGNRPDTPNFDLLAPGSDERKRITGTETGRPSKLGPRGLKAMEIAKSKGRIRGNDNARVTDDELVEHCRAMIRKHPGTTMIDEFYAARWIEKVSATKVRFAAAWEEASGGKKMPRRATGATKAPAAKKVGAKKAVAKKATQVAAFRKTTGRKAPARKKATAARGRRR